MGRKADRLRHIPRWDNEDRSVCGLDLKTKPYMRFYPAETDTKFKLLRKRKQLNLCLNCIIWGG